MASVFDVAKYILHKTGAISTWKLQKLCYYAQAWSLAWTEKPIFAEEFEAWSNGPVCPPLYQVHRGKFSVNENEIPYGNADNLNADQKETIDVVLEGYGNREPYDLREQTHAEKPWIEARGNLPTGARCNTVIPKSVMGEFYGSL